MNHPPPPPPPSKPAVGAVGYLRVRVTERADHGLCIGPLGVRTVDDAGKPHEGGPTYFIGQHQFVTQAAMRRNLEANRV